ncbi:MAG: YciI family protein [Anaerolineales bacterium]
MAEQNEKVQFVVFHRPGPKWQPGVDFREQPGVMEHVQHYAKLHAEGKLAAGGPFLEADRGGMMVAKAEVSREEIEAFAAADPAVKTGLLVYEVVPWYTPMRAG